jgi:AcrR family transcriptional regulator
VTRVSTAKLSRRPDDLAFPHALRDQILVQAAILFQQRGYENTTMRAIANRLKMSPGAIYWHFSSKADVLASFLESSLKEFVGVIETNVVGVTPTERLQQLVRQHVRFVLADRDTQEVYNSLFGWNQLANHLTRAQRAKILVWQRRHVALVRNILQMGVASNEFRQLDITPTAFAIISLCDYVITWYRADGRLDLDAVSDLYADLVVAMVARQIGDGDLLVSANITKPERTSRR